MKKLKVLQFPIANSQGGITQYVLQNWKFIDKSKFHFDFATMSKKLDFANELEKDGCKIHYISSYAEEDEKQFKDEIYNILTSENYDVIHLHTKQWKSFILEEIAKQVGVKKIIVHAHNTGIDTLNDKKRKEEQILHNYVKEQLTEQMATDYWACSVEAADFLFGNKIAKNKIKIMKNAVDLNKFFYNKEIRNKMRKELQLENNYVIGHVGRFEYQKNHEFLINIFSEVVKKMPIAKLLLVGNGELYPYINKLVHDYKLEENIILLGQRSDVADLYQAMDLFVLPSRFEGLGIVGIEAQAAGLPCLFSEMVPEEVCVSPLQKFIALDQEKWIECILETYNENAERQTNIKMIIDAGYSINNQIKRIENAYCNI